jgi:hypothetical protein
MSEVLLSDSPNVHPVDPKERRDVRRALDHWLRQISAESPIPLLKVFDFSSIKDDWNYRFLICTDQHVEKAAFVAYGTNFAKLLGLPERVTGITCLAEQIPERYQELFAEGCSRATAKRAPARFSGEFENDFTVELYRAVFLPIQLHPSWSKWLIFGSFNSCTTLSVDKKAQ